MRTKEQARESQNKWYRDTVRTKQNIEPRRALVSAVLRNPGKNQTDYARELDIPAYTLSLACRQLVAEGMLVWNHNKDNKLGLFFYEQTVQRKSLWSKLFNTRKEI